ncbi:sensor domain-containing diguanylate cyclase [Marinobacter orientalis]|uniref:diguanylate cyclase n=1 Tax=Marinobacter orientalis TaxID=1928859 RepID=A0A7Y0RAU3_9GAMM|nr:diguanylate cyclase [Marinobacter orientalis]NMT62308.1 diguanylate cyclase [Marinobacter orientalis]TGX51015.1 diguanylate cyclase [Marinobacter orientalis]
MKNNDLDWWLDLVPDAALVVGQDQMVVAANARADAMFGAPQGALRSRALEVLIPEASRQAHRQHVAGFFRQQTCRAMGSGLRLQGQRLDGQLRPMDIMLNRIQVANQELTMVVIRDDSERVAMVKLGDELAATTARLARAQEVGGLGWWEYDSDGQRLIWSPMVPAILGVPEEVEPSLALVAEQCHQDDRPHLRALHQNLMKAPGTCLTYRIRRPDGELRWIRETIDHGTGNRVLGVMRDITTEKTLEDRLRAESTIDDLTGLYNRKQFNRDLKSRYADYTRLNRNTSMIMYDFDHFKNINDCHGHLMGDNVLRQAAEIVAGQLRASDNAYRLGGEEFAIIIGNTGPGDARKLAERVRSSVEAARFRLGDSIVRATVSLGISQFRASDTNFEDIFRRADEAVYQSKSASRNTVRVVA